MATITYRPIPTTERILIVEKDGKYIGVLSWDKEENVWKAYKDGTTTPCAGHYERQRAAEALDEAYRVPHWQILTGSQYAKVLVNIDGEPFGYMVRCLPYEDWVIYDLHGNLGHAKTEFDAMKWLMADDV